MVDKLKISWVHIALVILLLPIALLYNLGLLTFIEDESIRALVALEMKLSGDWITPTLNGDNYYNKPPLYNWFIMASYYLTGRIDELSARIPTIISLLSFGGLVYYFARKKYSQYTALISALAIITCGRMLFWDSFLGLIDTAFSLVIFANFMLLYFMNEKEKYTQFFLVSYLLFTAAFLLKGLPAVVFQGLSLAAYFIWKKKFRILFSKHHFLGMVPGILILVAYYLVYALRNDSFPMVETLYEQSAMRTPLYHSIKDTILQVFVFPFEMIYHFLPWTLLVILFFDRRSWQWLKGDNFLIWCLIILFSNIWIYWISPGTFPRYLFMFLPLLFYVFIRLYELHSENNSKVKKVLDGIFLGILVLFAIGVYYIPFTPQLDMVSYRWPKTIALSISFLLLAWFYLKQKQYRLFYLAIALLIIRIFFNDMLFLNRNVIDSHNIYRQDALRIAKTYEGNEIKLYKETLTDYTLSFYYSSTTNRILDRAFDNFKKGQLYLIDTKEYGLPDSFVPIDSLMVRNGNRTFALTEYRE